VKKLWLTVAFVACTNPSFSRITPVGPSVVIPGTTVADVRDSVAAALTSRGYTLLAKNDERIVAEMPVRSDWSGSYYSHREYAFSKVSAGVSVSASDNLIDRAAPSAGANNDRREAAQGGRQKSLNDELLALKEKLSR
jgi:hypothetical protein